MQATITTGLAIFAAVLAAVRWWFVDRKKASSDQVEVLERRITEYRDKVDAQTVQIIELRGNLAKCDRRCDAADERVRRVEEEVDRWRKEAAHWQRMALGEAP